MKYRIRETPSGFIVERQRVWPWWAFLWLHQGQYEWCSHDAYMAPNPTTFTSADEAEESLKVSVIQHGIRRAHTRVVRTIPPWSKT